MTRREGDAAAPAPCVGDEQLAAYVDGRGSATKRRAIEAHLSGCNRCRAVVSDTVASLQQDGQRRTPVRRRIWPNAALVAAIAATMVLAVIAGYVPYARRASPFGGPEDRRGNR